MTLTELLEIERRLLAPEDELGLSYAELHWIDAGMPREPRALCRALKRILYVCQREGVRYPPILLRRKKELERGT
jgi:hypothetical protein